MPDKAILNITVAPKSSRSQIIIDSAGNIKVYLNSPPVDGKANIELIKLFSKQLHIAKSRITIDQGEQGRKKRLIIDGYSCDEVMAKLA